MGTNLIQQSSFAGSTVRVDAYLLPVLRLAGRREFEEKLTTHETRLPDERGARDPLSLPTVYCRLTDTWKTHRLGRHATDTIDPTEDETPLSEADHFIARITSLVRQRGPIY